MISSISRHLARTSSVAVASKFIRPAVTQQTNFSQRAFSSDSEEKSFGLSRKDISNIVSAEYGMSGAEAKRIVDTVFDTMVEVRIYYLLYMYHVSHAPSLIIHIVPTIYKPH